MIFYFDNKFFSDELKKAKIPKGAVAISNELHMDLLNNLSNRGSIGIDVNGMPYSVPPSEKTLSEHKADYLEKFEAMLFRRLDNPIASNALGPKHFYNVGQEARQHLNELITLGAGGKVLCKDLSNVMARLTHTHAQLLTLAADIRAAIDNKLDNYDLIQQQIAAAATVEELAAITWN